MKRPILHISRRWEVPEEWSDWAVSQTIFEELRVNGGRIERRVKYAVSDLGHPSIGSRHWVTLAHLVGDVDPVVTMRKLAQDRGWTITEEAV